MNYSLLDLLKFIGAIGLFLYGMKLMSEALQKVAGSKMRSIFASMTSNRVFGVLTGFVVSAIVQSSSATVLMVVSFVNAGLVSLVESIGVVMGANVGTTATGWVVSLVGFRFNFAEYALPLMAIGFPLVFSKRLRHRSWGEAIIGFSIIFVSLSFLENVAPNINGNPAIHHFLSSYTHLGFVSVLVFLLAGCILTFIIQSSGVAMVITFVMSSQGWISYELGAAMILGENLGTTITPNIAATVANITAKRTARFHFLFNVVGVIWVLAIFTPFTKWVHNIMTNNSHLVTTNPKAVIPLSLALFHTLFNVINMLLFIGFVPWISRLISDLINSKEETGEEFKLRYITTGILSNSDLSILQAKKELQFFATHTHKMLKFNQRLLSEENKKRYNRLFTNIIKYESAGDDVEIEIAGYLAKIPQDKISEISRKRIHSMLKLVSDLENIGASSYAITRIINRMHKNNIQFSPLAIDHLNNMLLQVENALLSMQNNLSINEKKIQIEKAEKIEIEINEHFHKLKTDHIEYIDKKEHRTEASAVFYDIINECEKIGNYALNVSQALKAVKK